MQDDRDMFTHEQSGMKPVNTWLAPSSLYLMMRSPSSAGNTMTAR